MLNRTPRLAAALVSATLLASLAVSTVSAAAPIHGNGHGPGHGPELDRELAAVRAATQRFQDPNEAVKAGYGLPPAPAPLHECISSFDDTGAMGFHYINGNLLDTTVDALQPEALVYAPDSAGQAPPGRARIRRLPGALDRRARHQEDAVAVPPDVHVDRRARTGFAIPAFFSLHLWLYQDNPAGLFEPFNPTVSCGAAAQGAGAAPTRPRLDVSAGLRLLDRSLPIGDPARLTRNTTHDTEPPFGVLLLKPGARRAPGFGSSATSAPAHPPARRPSRRVPSAHDRPRHRPAGHRARRAAVQRPPDPPGRRERFAGLLLGEVRRRTDPVRGRPVHDDRRHGRGPDRPAALFGRLPAGGRRERGLRVLCPSRPGRHVHSPPVADAGRPGDADDRPEGQVHAAARTTSGRTSSSRPGPATRRSWR